MLTKEWKMLKNGSDIRGVAVETQNSPVTLTDEKVYAVMKAFCVWLKEKTGKDQLKVAVGNDSRISADRIKKQVVKAVEESGFTCIDCGLISTPAMFMTTIVPELNCDGSVQITASHLPYDRNGLKFFTKEGGLEGGDIENVLELASANKALAPAQGKTVKYDFLSVYAKMLVNKVRNAVNAENFDEPLKGFKIVVDAGNGAGGFYAKKVLEPLGADISASQFLEPDGMFPNHIPNPENEEAMASVSKAVVEAKADLGIIFDTDVDRAGAVDSQGNEINRNRLIALISAILLEEKKPAVIVTDSITSTGLKKFIENHGGMHHRFKRGYKNVINEAVRLNKEGQYCPLAIETSGHAALKENYFLDDGAYLVTKLIIQAAILRKQGKQLSDLLLGLEEPAESKEFRLKINTEDFREYGNKVITQFGEFIKNIQDAAVLPENYEGIRVNFSDAQGWILVRLSLHDPIIPINIESNVPGGVKAILRSVYPFFAQCDELDTSLMKEYLNSGDN